MISVLIPTRDRVEWFKRTVDSINATAFHAVEVIAYVDDDDPQLEGYRQYFKSLGIGYVEGPRIILTACWNKCFKIASGDILMQGNDDIIFDTKGWDTLVVKAFDACPDKILFVHGDDLGPRGKTFGTHGLVHRKWIKTIGYFIAPYFSSDYGDTWLNEVADELGRHRYLPFIIEHMHCGLGKAPIDQTTRDRLQRHKTDKVEQIWELTLPNRLEDVRRLRAVMIP